MDEPVETPPPCATKEPSLLREPDAEAADAPRPTLRTDGPGSATPAPPAAKTTAPVDPGTTAPSAGVDKPPASPGNAPPVTPAASTAPAAEVRPDAVATATSPPARTAIDAPLAVEATAEKPRSTARPTLDDAAVAAGAGDANEGDDQAAAEAPPEKPGLPRWPFIVAVGLALVGVGVGFAYQPILRQMIERKAAGLGVDLEFDSASFRFGEVRLQGARARLDGVSMLDIKAESVRIELDGFEASNVTADGVTIAIEGSPIERILELGAWSSDHRQAYQTPGSANGIQLDWRTKAGAASWLSASNGTLKSTGKGATLKTPSAKLAGAPPSAFGASWTVDKETISLGLGKETWADAPLTLVVHTGKAPSVELGVKAISLETAAAALGGSMTAKGATISGSADLKLGEHAGSEAIEGHASVLIDGWIPPHPKEASAILTGKKTSLTTGIRVAPNRSTATLTGVEVVVGNFKMKGSGTLEGGGDHVLAKLDLKGTVRCADVAHTQLPNMGPLNPLLGEVAKRAVDGNVAVTVDVELDSRHLESIKEHHKLGVGCGLKMPL